MRVGPNDGIAFRFEKAINHQRVLLRSSMPAIARRFSAHHRGSGIDRDTLSVGKNDFAPVGNLFWIDSAISRPQSGAVPCRMLAAAFIAPIAGDPNEHRLLASECLRREKQHQADIDNQQFHISPYMADLQNPDLAGKDRLLTNRNDLRAWLSDKDKFLT